MLKPSDVSPLTSDLEVTAKLIEESIDLQLRKNPEIAKYDCSKERRDAVFVMAHRYEAAGWNVEVSTGYTLTVRHPELIPLPLTKRS